MVKVVKLSPRVYNVEYQGVLLETVLGNGRRAHRVAAQYSERLNRVTKHTLQPNVAMRRDTRPQASAGQLANVREKGSQYRPGKVRAARISPLPLDKKLPSKYDRVPAAHDYYRSRRPWRRQGRVTGSIT